MFQKMTFVGQNYSKINMISDFNNTLMTSHLPEIEDEKMRFDEVSTIMNPMDNLSEATLTFDASKMARFDSTVDYCENTNDLQLDKFEKIGMNTETSYWRSSTKKMAMSISENLKSQNSIKFSTFTRRTSRKTASLLFYDLLVLSKHTCIDTQQSTTFSDITISRGEKYSVIDV
ncbi:hypothetical protein A3Q56_08177 [Intoshia linei]|uniref:Rad21/Rec8-like protein C-terminal eukaryotic domain-containing protein n=1 Tax=Intoshia linei TaxID=1819745 RepID=A0A177ARV6_9BILA|nr:hypothetical protein A3Q56_08177 [Intoshia linei]